MEVEDKKIVFLQNYLSKTFTKKMLTCIITIGYIDESIDFFNSTTQWVEYIKTIIYLKKNQSCKVTIFLVESNKKLG